MQTLEEKSLADRIIDFSTYCRARQFMVSPQQTQEAFEICKQGFALNRKIFRNALKAIYCKRKEHSDRFDEMFDRFWSRQFNENLEARIRSEMDFGEGNDLS